MQQKKSINLGFRGWMLVIFQAIALFTFTIFTNWPLNLLSDMYGGSNIISTLLTGGTLVGIIFQLIMSRYVGKVKSVKWTGVIFGAISLILGFCIMTLPAGNLWLVCYFFENFTVTVYATFWLSILVGQWFPRRKGTVMGIATFAFPITNGIIGVFAKMVFAKGYPDVFGAYLPFFILAILGLLVGVVFIKDYPEQCGAYRDNDKSFTPEMAQAMMEEEIENKKTSVWKLGAVLKCRDFWFITIPLGALLMCSVGMMTQSSAIIGSYPKLPFVGTMTMIMIVGCFGSWLMGVLDTKFGTKFAITCSVVCMILTGVLGAIGTTTTTVLALIFLAIFQGAGSNFTVSASAQYWRREDFPSVFSAVNPIANILQCAGPMMIAITLNAVGVRMPFVVTAVIAVICLVLILCFKPAHVKEVDDQYRAKAGKPMDDALVGRK